MSRTKKNKMTKKKAAAPALWCECGGRLRPTILPTYDFTPYTGVPATMTHVPGFKCTKCGGATIPGHVINDALKAAVLAVTKLSRRLSKSEAKFIRRIMGITQEDLARRIGVVRETVAKWETVDGPSAQHDLLLRVVALTPLVHAGWLPEGAVAAIIPNLAEVRQEPPPLESLVPLDLGRHHGTEMRA